MANKNLEIIFELKGIGHEMKYESSSFRLTANEKTKVSFRPYNFVMDNGSEYIREDSREKAYTEGNKNFFKLFYVCLCEK